MIVEAILILAWLALGAPVWRAAFRKCVRVFPPDWIAVGLAALAATVVMCMGPIALILHRTAIFVTGRGDRGPCDIINILSGESPREKKERLESEARVASDKIESLESELKIAQNH